MLPCRYIHTVSACRAKTAMYKSLSHPIATDVAKRTSLPLARNSSLQCQCRLMSVVHRHVIAKCRKPVPLISTRISQLGFM